MKSYQACTTGIWEAKNLINGLGFKSWAEAFIPGGPTVQLPVFQKIQLILCTGSVIVMFFYYLKKRKQYTLHSFLLCSLKVYLAIFYAFIQLPFKYLYLVPIVVSASLLSGVLTKKETITTPSIAV